MFIYAVIGVGLLYGLFGFLVAKGSTGNAYLSNGIFNGIAAFVCWAVVSYQLAQQTSGSDVLTNKSTLAYNAAAGIVLTVFSVALVKLFATGQGIGYILPVVYGSAIVFGTVLAVAVSKEKVGMLQLAGLVLVVAGIGLIAYAKK